MLSNDDRHHGTIRPLAKTMIYGENIALPKDNNENFLILMSCIVPSK